MLGRARAAPIAHRTLGTVWATLPYRPPWRRLVVAHKEEQVWSLTPVLADLLGQSVRSALTDGGGRGTDLVVLVPVPSRPGRVRRRGYDPLGVLARRVAQGLGVHSVPLLRSRGGVQDQAGLDAAQRRRNVAGSMCVPSARLAALAALARGSRPGPRRPLRLLLVDDVLTTGSTLLEAERALRAVGIACSGAAVVAATPSPQEELGRNPSHFR